MSTPLIREGQPLANALVKILGKSFKELDATDGTSDGYISLYQLVRNNNRIAKPSSGGVCENVYIVDNGDRKLGGDDLFLYSDGFFKENGEFAFRFGTFSDIQFQTKSSYDDGAAESALFPANIKPLVDNMKLYFGHSFNEAISQSNSVCKTLRW